MSPFHCAVLAAISTLTFPAAALAAPAVTVSPAVGHPTQTITATGTGFAPNAAVDVYFDLTDLCLTFSDASGRAKCTIAVPASAQPQQHWVSMLQRSDSSGAQKSFLVRTDMAQFHGRNALHNGVNPFENTINTSNVGNLDVLWRQPIGAGARASSPVVSGGNIYVGSFDNKLFAFNATSGAPLAGFPVTLGGFVNGSTPAVGGGNVYVGADDDKLYAFNATTGAAIPGFPVTLGGRIESPPSLALGNVYIGALDDKLYAFNATTGATVSGFPTPVGGTIPSGSPTVFNGDVFVGAADFKLYGFNGATAATVSGFPVLTGGTVRSTVAAVAGQLYFGSDDDKLYGVNATDGTATPGFPFTTGATVLSSPAAAGGKVFVGSGDGKLYSIRSNDGATNFAVTVEADAGSIVGSPMIANGVIYISGLKLLHAVSLGGTLLWSAPAQNIHGFNSPVVANGVVYYADSDGFITAYSVNGQNPSARLPGGELGVQPALSALRPNFSLMPSAGAATGAPAEYE